MISGDTEPIKGGTATVNKFLSALRGVLKAAWRLGLISAEDKERAGDVPCVSGERLPRGRSLVDDCLKDSDEDDKELGVRDAALVALL